MFLTDDQQLILSATDLTRAAQCEFAVMRDLDGRLGLAAPLTRVDDALLDRVAALGTAHERQTLDAYRTRYGRWQGAGGGVAELDMVDRDTATLTQAAAQTRTLLDSDPDVIYQACFFDGSFLGYADFITRDGDTWTVQDTKLARRARVPALIQLGAYADQLLAAGFTPSDRVELILGTGVHSAHRTDEVVAVFRARMSRLRGLLEGRLGASAALEWEAPGVRACLQCDVCEPHLEDRDDVILVAGATVSQRDRLAGVGIRTVADLAASTGSVDGVGASSLDRLRAQAALQHRQDSGTGDVLCEVADPAAISALPEPSPGDIFFDFEGDPLWFDEAAPQREDAWGLEYLFGYAEAPVGGAEPVFRALWAHDRAQEKAALLLFLDYVTQRRQSYQDMHIYHYAPYERSALLKLVGRYGVGEEIVDQWLREGLLVDLYATVRAGVRIGQRSYSLKKLEPLFREARAEDVTTAGDSIVAYAEACAARDLGDEDGWRQQLDAIAEYNEVDCVATWQLREWLRAQVPDRTTPAAAPESETDDSGAREGEWDWAPLAGALMEHAGDPPRDRDRQAVAMLAATLGYHVRDDKPFWWAHFDRLASDPSEWLDRRSTMVADEVSLVDDWHVPPKKRTLKRRIRMIGRLEPGSDLRAGSKAFAIYDPPVPASAQRSATGRRGWFYAALVERVETIGASERHELIVLESLPGAAAEHSELPMGLGPTNGPKGDKIAERLCQTGQSVLEGLPGELPRTAAMDLLRRQPPRTLSGTALPAQNSTSAGQRVPIEETITQALLALNDSYLAVQGPPGTGKTYSGARVVARLIERGWKIAVVAQSHAVVENFLRAAERAGVPTDQIAKTVKSGSSTTQKQLGWAKLTSAWLASRPGGSLTGGTAWTYVNEDCIPEGRYDLIVVDEAGQFALANTVAVTAAARRVLLLGDPQQLPQVSQGTHPEPVDASALGWLLAEHDTLPREYGYFLGQTWRMQEKLCAAVSQMSYEGRLTAHPSTGERWLAGVDPGVTGVPVEHDGNSVVAAEEVAEVLAQLRDLVGRDWHDGAVARPLTAADVLIVAPYNAQVWAIRHALDASPFTAARVGTVDKFQGQEAPVVLVSLAASSADDVARGMDFLLNRNRLNVAISRAQWCARVIYSPAIADYLPSRPDQLGELGAFLQAVGPTSR